MLQVSTGLVIKFRHIPIHWMVHVIVFPVCLMGTVEQATTNHSGVVFISIGSQTVTVQHTNSSCGIVTRNYTL